MKNYTSITNLDTTNPADDPNGTMKEETSAGAQDGTVYDKTWAADFYALFWKCVRESGITPNDDFDNETNGYQLHQAMFGTPWVTISVFTNGAATSTGPLTGGKGVRYRKVQGGKYVHLEGWYAPATVNGNTAFTLPVGYRPASPGIVAISANDGANGSITYNVDGTISDNLAAATSVFVNVLLPLD